VPTSKLPIIRTSERRDFGRCPWRWHQAWRRGLVPLGQDAPALIFGGWVHEALAAWYCGPGLKRGPHPAETFEKVSDTDLLHIRTEARSRGQAAEGGTEFFIEEKMVPALELGRVMLEGYVEFWGSDDSWSVIEPERSGELLVVDPTTEEARPLAYYGFTYDLIYRDLADGSVKLGEHKTAKAISTDHLPLDPQAGSYWAIAGPHLRSLGMLRPKEDIAGITYNFLRKALPDDRPKNADGHATNKPKKEHYIAALADVDVARVTSVSKGTLVPLEKATLADLEQAARTAVITVVGEVSSLQPKPLFEREFVYKSRSQRARQIERIGLEAKEMDALRGRPDSQIRKNPTKDCHWDCRFKDLCVLDEEGGDTKSFRKEIFRVRDPYASHRKSTEE
jgi:hypothetical protein